MAQINTCLKSIFIIFTILLAIIGGLIIAAALFINFVLNFDGDYNTASWIARLLILYIVGTFTVVIAIIGACGAKKESRGALIAFLVCMVVGSLLMLRGGISTAVVRPKLEGVLEEAFRKFLPLDDASDDVKTMVNGLQSELHCCGLFSYKDWGQNIPDSCLCSQEEEAEGECQQTRHRLLMQTSRSVYTKTCFPVIMQRYLLTADIVIGVFFTLAVMALLGMALSSLMIHQLRYANRPAVLLSVPAVFSTQPPKYQELHNNPPPY